MLSYVYLCKWSLQLYSVTNFHKTTISSNKEDIACFCKKKRKKRGNRHAVLGFCLSHRRYVHPSGMIRNVLVPVMIRNVLVPVMIRNVLVPVMIRNVLVPVLIRNVLVLVMIRNVLVPVMIRNVL